MNLKLGDLVKDDLNNVFRAFQELTHWKNPNKKTFMLTEITPQEGRHVCCNSEGNFCSAYNGHGSKIVKIISEV